MKTFNCQRPWRYAYYDMPGRFYIYAHQFSQQSDHRAYRVEWRMPKGPCHGYSPMSGIWHRDGGYWTVIFVNLLIECCGPYCCLGDDGKPYSPHTAGKPNAGINNAIYDPNQKRFPSLILALLAGRPHVMVDSNDVRVRDLLEISMPWRKTSRLEKEQRQRRTA